jgi:uncharacterized protein (UPF0210 family)
MLIDESQHEQVKVDRSQTLTEFIKEDGVNLTHGVHYMLTDMAVTSDSKLLPPTPFSYVYRVVLCIVSSVDKLYG